jgi:cardiolipin synthase A/B
MIHAKTLVADGWLSKVGSTNLNFASLAANWEIDLLVEDTGFAGQMERLFVNDMSNSREVRLEGSGRRPRVRPERRVDTNDSEARAGVVGSGAGSGATVSRVGTTLLQKTGAPLQTHEHVLAAASSGALFGVSLLGARFPRLVAWPLAATGAFFGGLGLLRAVRSAVSDRVAASDSDLTGSDGSPRSSDGRTKGAPR